METTLADWRSLRRKLTFWRVLTILLVALGLFAIWQVFNPGGREKQSDHIARITISGVISDDPELIERIGKIADNDSAKALIVSIASPGGTTYGGETIYKALRKVSAKKPVISEVRTLAASAGYMIAVAGDSIVAGDTSITGSIGVIFQYPQIKPLLDKLGVSLEEIKSSPMKAEPSPFHPPPEEAKTMINAMVMDSYDWFVDIVAERRNLSRDKVLELANGTIFTGRQALKVGLVDRLGDLDDIREILETKKVAADLPIVDWQPVDESSPFFLAGSFVHFMKLFGLGDYSASDEMKRLFGDKLFLDGLVSVWQFATK